MSLSNDLKAYSDVKGVLDAALAKDGGRYTLPTESKAYHWRARAYKYRKLLEDSMMYVNPYAELIMTLDGETVVIELRKIEGKFTTLDGKRTKVKEGVVSEVETVLSLDDDLLLEEAKKLVEEQGK